MYISYSYNTLDESWPPSTHRFADFILIYVISLNYLFELQEAVRGAAAQSMTVKPTGCGFDPHSKR